jgi:hypothetical protein
MFRFPVFLFLLVFSSAFAQQDNRSEWSCPQSNGANDITITVQNPTRTCFAPTGCNNTNVVKEIVIKVPPSDHDCMICKVEIINKFYAGEPANPCNPGFDGTGSKMEGNCSGGWCHFQICDAWPAYNGQSCTDCESAHLQVEYGCHNAINSSNWANQTPCDNNNHHATITAPPCSCIDGCVCCLRTPSYTRAVPNEWHIIILYQSPLNGGCVDGNKFQIILHKKCLGFHTQLCAWPAEDINHSGSYEDWPSTECYDPVTHLPCIISHPPQPTDRGGWFGDQDGIDNDNNGLVDDVMRPCVNFAEDKNNNGYFENWPMSEVHTSPITGQPLSGDINNTDDNLPPNGYIDDVIQQFFDLINCQVDCGENQCCALTLTLPSN